MDKGKTKQTIAKFIRLIIAVGAALGFWALLGEHLWYKYIVSPVVVFPEELQFTKRHEFSQQQFRVINRSPDPQFNVELQVFVEGLDDKFEMVELKHIRESKRPDSANQSKSPSREELKEELARVVPTRVIVPKNCFFGTKNTEKGQTRFLYARIPELKPKGTEPFAVAFYSIRQGISKRLIVTPAIWGVGADFITMSEPDLHTSRAIIEHIDVFDIIPTHLPMRKPALFSYQDNPVEVLLDAKKRTWYRADQVCWILKIQNVSEALEGLELNEKRTFMYDPGPNVSSPFEITVFIGKKLGHFAKMTKKPLAEAFLVWVSKVVTLEKVLEKAPEGAFFSIK